MENNKQEALAEYERRLFREVPEAESIVLKFKRAGHWLRRVEPATELGEQRTWLLFWTPNRALAESFDLAPELLLVLTPWAEAQARDVSAAEEALTRDYRLDKGIVLVVARDGEAERRLSQSVRHTGRLYIFLPFEQVLAAQDTRIWLRQILRDRLGSADLFAAGRPVFGWDFIGREKEIQTIRRKLLDGRPVGLYGLRKAGKTSVLIAIRDQLVADAGRGARQPVAVPIHLDLLGLSFAELKRSGFMRYLLRAMHEALERVGIEPATLGLPPSFADRRRLSELAEQDVERLVPQALECLIDWAAGRPSSPTILLFIDEYERILGTSQFPLADGLDIFDYLRGLVQRYPGVFNFLITGLGGAKASVSRYGTRQNPLFNFVIDYPLAGLTREEMDVLLGRIGRRLSLGFLPEALQAIWRETGGHPYLARELGRLIDKGISMEERAARNIDLAAVQTVLPLFHQEIAATMTEIRDAVADIDPNATSALLLALQYPSDSADALAMLKPESLHALRRYGIVNEPGAPEPVRIGCFGEWLLRNEVLPLKAAANA